MSTFPMCRSVWFAVVGAFFVALQAFQALHAEEAVPPTAVPPSPASTPVVIEASVTRDPFTEAITLPVGQRITAQAQKTAADISTALAPNRVPELTNESSGDKLTTALQPLHLILRGSTPHANGVWIALVEEPTSKLTLVVRVGQTIHLPGHQLLVTKIEATTIWLQSGEKIMAFSQ